ncbi:unnamed protein product [Psylliodes chrysocephalus]|uniref:Uncharacterized protein n=1 Tax=Psylliodes chrysocephalus TaxID=3402493 RepID=A0A9P0D813_9CUCU|nr:unnamed protein product [Psylliodes chrysocephala]
MSKENYEAHILRKEEARLEKEVDETRNDFLTDAMDLQALLLCPRSNVSTLYYKMKLATNNFTIYNLADYMNVCRQARENPAEYNVEYLGHTYFMNFEAHIFFKSIRPGKVVGNLCVTALQYVPDGTIKFKFNVSDE